MSVHKICDFFLRPECCSAIPQLISLENSRVSRLPSTQKCFDLKRNSTRQSEFLSKQLLMSISDVNPTCILRRLKMRSLNYSRLRASVGYLLSVISWSFAAMQNKHTNKNLLLRSFCVKRIKLSDIPY